MFLQAQHSPSFPDKQPWSQKDPVRNPAVTSRPGAGFVAALAVNTALSI